MSSLNPQEIDEELIRRLKDNNKLCRHLHISIQSADNKILKLMNRKYTNELIASVIEKLIIKVKDIGISADFIVGFPQEDDKNFRKTLKLVEDYDFVKSHIFTYSDRKGTASYNLKDKIDQKVKKKRYLELKSLLKESARRFKRRFINKALDVIIERQNDKKTNLLTGYSDNYIKILILNGQEDHRNKLIPAKIVSFRDNSTFARI